MLKNGSIDAWAYGDIAGIWLLNKSGAAASDYEAVYVLGQTSDYYAFNKETPDSLVQSFQQAVDYIKNHKDENGVSDYEKICSKYTPLMKQYAPSWQNINPIFSYIADQLKI
jgi:polar amino acid transport system substrate-binding protein